MAGALQALAGAATVSKAKSHPNDSKSLDAYVPIAADRAASGALRLSPVLQCSVNDHPNASDCEESKPRLDRTGLYLVGERE